VSNADDLLRRLERRALVLAAAAVAIAWVVPGGGSRTAAGVAGGALVSGVSYWAIRRGTSSLASAVLGGARPRTRRGVGLFIARYALLAGIAYVMIARLRLPPIALLCGASVLPVAAAAELLRRRP
jgi:hypothetical protein